MRILMVTQCFPPEMGALSHRMYPFARHLSIAGHEVSVATCLPNYPDGIVFEGYRGHRRLDQIDGGVRVLRTACYTAPRNQRKLSQLRSYLSFVPAALRSGMRAGPVDVVFVTSPPLFPTIAAAMVASARRARLVLDLRDLWPDEIVACGGARDGSATVRAVRAIERWAYRRADAVCCTTESFRDTVINRGADARKVVLLPNGADVETFRPLPRINPVGASLAPSDAIVVMYCGALGIKHGLGTVIDAAEKLRELHKLVFVLVGNGAARAQLQQRVCAAGLTSVSFPGERPLHDLPFAMARADICVSSLLPEPYLEKIISVKVFEYLACARPVVAAQSGETARIVARSGGGLVVPPGDAGAFAAAVAELAACPERRACMGETGREYVVANYSRSVTARQLERVLERVLRGAPQSPAGLEEGSRVEAVSA